MTDETPSRWWVPGYLLESLHRAGFSVSIRDGRVIVTHPEREVDKYLRAEIERHHDALLKMLRAAEELDRMIKGGTKGTP